MSSTTGITAVVGRRLQRAQHLEAVAAGHHHVEHDQVGQQPLGLEQRVLAVFDGGDLEALGLQVQQDDRAHPGVVVGEQHPPAAAVQAGGKGERSKRHASPTTITRRAA